MKNIVSIRRLTEANPTLQEVLDADVDSAVRGAVEAAGGLESFVQKGDRVLITPNLIRPVSHETGIVTSPHVIATLIDLVQEAGGEPVVGECPPFGVDGDEVMDVCGMKAVAEQRGVEARNLENDDAVKVRIPRAKALRYVMVTRTALECDAIISVPVLKNNMFTGITCGLKKMMGVVPGLEKSHIHTVGVEQSIADLNTLVLPDMVVVDATVTMEGDAGKGTMVPLGLVIAGRDPVATDAVCASIIGLSEDETKHISLAAEYGLGTRDLNKITIDGPSIKEVERPFEKPWRKLSNLKKLGEECGIEVNAEEACPACIGVIFETFNSIKNRGQLEGVSNIKKIAIGTNANVPEEHGDCLVVGNCLSEFSDSPNFLAGCPPNAHLFYKKMNEICEDFDIEKLKPSKSH